MKKVKIRVFLLWQKIITLSTTTFVLPINSSKSQLFSTHFLHLFNQSSNIFSNCSVFIFRIIFITSCLSCGKSSNLCPRRNDLMYGNTVKAIGAKSGLYGGCFRHLNQSKSNSSWVVWEVCADALSWCSITWSWLAAK